MSSSSELYALAQNASPMMSPKSPVSPTSAKSGFDTLRPYDSPLTVKSGFDTLRPSYDSPIASKSYVLDGVEVQHLDRGGSSRTEMDEFPALPVSLDVEGQKLSETSPPIAIHMPKTLQPYVAEACGMATMIIIGLITNIQSNLTGDPENPRASNWVAYAFGWGVGLMLGLLVTIDVSGGHINPAITLTQALFRGFSWRRVLGYWFAQLIGAFLAGCIVLGLYYDLLDQYEGGNGVRTWRTATLFIDRPPAWETNIDAFFHEVIAAGLLLLGVASVTDPGAAAQWQTSMKSLLMSWVLVCVNGCLGVYHGYALNPARDLGVRLSCLAFGYNKDIFTDRHWYWTWGSIIGPFVGGVLFTFLYDVVVRGRVEFTIPALQRLVYRKRKSH